MGWKTGRSFLARLPAFGTGGIWVGLLARYPRVVETYSLPARNLLVPALGACSIAALLALHQSQSSRFQLADRVLLTVAALPGLLLIASTATSYAGIAMPLLFTNAGWGLLFMFPGVMLVGSVLIRHRIIPGWNQVPAMSGFALPAGEFARRIMGSSEFTLAIAMMFSLAWIVLGCATGALVPLKPRQKHREDAEQRQPSG